MSTELSWTEGAQAAAAAEALAEPPLSPPLSPAHVGEAPYHVPVADGGPAPLPPPLPFPAPEPPAEEPLPAAAAPAPAPAAPYSPPPPAPALHRVLVRLTSGESIEVAAHGDEPAARAEAIALMRHLRDGRGDWPFFAGRFVRPETIVSVDVA